MRGIVIWLSPFAQSALIASDSGSNICFGTYNTAAIPGLAVGDLVFAPGVYPGDTKFRQGLQISVKGYLPQVANLVSYLGTEIEPPADPASNDMRAAAKA